MSAVVCFCIDATAFERASMRESRAVLIGSEGGEEESAPAYDRCFVDGAER